MSLHPSLKQGDSKGFIRTVLKRAERIKQLIKKGCWGEDGKVFGLPKTKIVRMKIAKKVKKEEAQDKQDSDKKPTK